MLQIFNTLGKKLEIFKPLRDRQADVFTCGPSVYQRSHIGNFRTFLFEDILVRYLEYSGIRVKRGMNLTDIEDKAFEEARKRRMTVKGLTEENIKKFIREMKLLNMKIPDYLPRASEAIDEIVKIIEQLLDRQIAYRCRGNIYFDPLKYPQFGELYGLDMSRWPKTRRRFHKDTYPGMRWNLGDFILWHGYKEGELSWDTPVGRGRPSWNVQDACLVLKYYPGTLSFYCGGIDNLFRHHDYTRAIVESVRPYAMSKYWLHCHHLIIEGEKMSKSKGNIFYVEDLLKDGYTAGEIRFFLIYGHYRRRLNYRKDTIESAAEKLRNFRRKLRAISRKAGKSRMDQKILNQVQEVFTREMDDDLNVQKAFDRVHEFVQKIERGALKPEAASGLIKGLRQIDQVLGVLF